MRIKAADIFLILLSVLITVLALELVLRAFPDTDILTRYDPLLGWSLIPNATGHNRTPEYNTVEHINSKGFRGPELAYEKAAGTRRVLVLGDSFTEGYAVNNDELFTTRLAAILKGSRAVSTDVINMGVAGYSTDQELLTFDSQGKRYAPDVTILMFYYNDVWYNNQGSFWRGCKPRFERSGEKLAMVPVNDAVCRAGSGHGIKAWLQSHSRLMGLIRDCVERNDLLTRCLTALHLKKVPAEFAPWRKTSTLEVEEAWQITGRLLAELKNRVESSGSKFMVFYIPSSLEIDAGIYQATMRRYGFNEEQWDPRQIPRRLSSLCAAEGIILVDPTAEFQQSGKLLYYAHDGHWNSQGNALAARLLADALTASRTRSTGFLWKS